VLCNAKWKMSLPSYRMNIFQTLKVTSVTHSKQDFSLHEYDWQLKSGVNTRCLWESGGECTHHLHKTIIPAWVLLCLIHFTCSLLCPTHIPKQTVFLPWLLIWNLFSCDKVCLLVHHHVVMMIDVRVDDLCLCVWTWIN
jgi:hypothetical protein